MERVKDREALTFSIWKRFYGGLKQDIIDHQLTQDWRQAMKLVSLQVQAVSGLQEASRAIHRAIYREFLKPYGFRRPRGAGFFRRVEIPYGPSQLNAAYHKAA